MAIRNKKAVNALYVSNPAGDYHMNPFEKAEFREALDAAFTQAINKVGLRAFKRISWFASNEMVAKDQKQAA
jgi:hypothetical protein